MSPRSVLHTLFAAAEAAGLNVVVLALCVAVGVALFASSCFRRPARRAPAPGAPVPVLASIGTAVPAGSASAQYFLDVVRIDPALTTAALRT